MAFYTLMHLWKELWAVSEGIRGTGKPLSGYLPDILNLQPDLRVLKTVKMWNAMVFSLVFQGISYSFFIKKCQGIFFFFCWFLLLLVFLKLSHHGIKKEIQIVPHFTVLPSADCLGPQRISQASHTKCSTKTLLFSVCSALAFPKAVGDNCSRVYLFCGSGPRTSNINRLMCQRCSRSSIQIRWGKIGNTAVKSFCNQK